MDQPVYQIAKWRETFETADSRRHRSLHWVSWPIEPESNGYQSLVDQRPDDAPAIYGAWAALITIAARCPKRGVLATSRGEPLTPERCARMAYMPAEPFRKLFDWASSESVRWLEVAPEDDEPTEGQPASDQSANNKQPAVDQPSIELPNQTLHNQTQPKKKRGKPRPESAEEVRVYCETRGNSVDPEAFYDHYESNGWKQANGNSIRDWQAAVRTWEKRERSSPKDNAKPRNYAEERLAELGRKDSV